MSYPKVLKGVDGVKSIYERTLKEAQVDFICLSAGFDEVLNGWWSGTYAKQLYASKIVTRELVRESEENRQAAEESNAVHQVKVMSDVALEGDIVVTAGWAAVVSFEKKQPYAVVFEDEGMVGYLTEVFGKLWEK